MLPGTTVDLSDKEAWDDTVLIRAYDRAVAAYQVLCSSPCREPRESRLLSLCAILLFSVVQETQGRSPERTGNGRNKQ